MLGLVAQLSTLANQLVGETVNTGSSPLSFHNPPVSSIPLPPVNDPIPSSVQGSISQTLMQSSVNKRNQVEPLRYTANATCLAASTPTTPDPVSQSLICSTTSGSEVTATDNPRERLASSHSLPAPSLAEPLPIALLEGAHDFQMGDLIVSVFGAGTQQDALEIQRGRLVALPKHPDMSGTRFEYIPNSRKPDVDKLCELASNSTILVLCIHGPAGIGKSTLADHLSDKFRSVGRLAATVFLSTIGAETSGPATIVKMIAHEIGCIHPRAIPKIVEAMDQCHGTSLENHLEKYILEPLRSLGHPQPLIIIMDAMDEWRDHPTFIRALASLNSEGSVVKFILTDRLNPCASRLPGINKVSIYTYALGPISNEVIKAYFLEHLETVPWVDGRKASSADVEKLTELSGGLPVWASTVIAILSYSFSESPPHEILAEIVGSRRQVGDSSDGLGDLYRNALERLFPSSDARKYFRWLMGATTVLQEPLSLVDFSTLTGIPLHLIKKIQFALSALQTRSPPLGSENIVHPATTLFHLSFLEYVQAPTTDTSFVISTFDSHSVIGLTCSKQVAILPPSSPRNNFPFRALQHYAVKYWPHHVFNGTRRSNSEWSQTEHCSTLQTIPDSGRRWAELFLEGLLPGEVAPTPEDVREEDGMALTLRNAARRLGETGGDHWGFQVACLEVAVRIDGGDAGGWSELGKCYGASGNRTGNLRMHEEAVVAFRRALDLRPDSHPNRGESLDSVAVHLWSSYELNGDSNVLSEAILCSRMALTFSPTPHPNRARYLNNLAGALNEIYSRTGSLETLNEVISLHREALALRPAPDPARSSSLNNLASGLRSLYDHDRNIDTLHEAISLHRDALTLHPVPHPDRPFSLNNLANALKSLYRCNRDIGGLNEAISLHREALALCPAPHPDRFLSLNNLANALDELHECNGDTSALTEGISLHREALGLCPAPHPTRSSLLNNLASCLHTLYQHNKDIGTLNECISLGHEGLALCPAPHPHRCSILDILANAYLFQFEQDGAVQVLDESVSLGREALVLCTPGQRYRAYYVKTLVQLLEKRREVIGDDRDCGEIVDLKAELAV
ncbi:hypothetical protein EST38_g11810 [Candolleomyces aberdarensis]|uniref:Nephrocystin 3-like N-terminal domain-containing protein n=1 Tax=Candolleomyces aberdarensis TaxID=2316362 RepID=A0A4Q2D6L0_9AGAR|nr:hypothetical protein EST38_g11810 [Candolleomyces aberdarensis]